MPALPAAADFTAGTTTEGQFKTAITDQRGFLAGLLGTTRTVAAAQTALGVLAGQYAAKVAAYTVQIADRGEVIDATTGTWTLSLPAAASAGLGFGFILRNSGAGTITLDPSGAELIDGVATVAVTAGRAVLAICTGPAWVTHWMIRDAVDTVYAQTIAGAKTFSSPLTVNNTVRIGTGTTFDLQLKGNVAPAVTVGGSALAAVITTYGTGTGSGHVGIEIPANDGNDGFYIATDSNLDGTPDFLAVKIIANGNVGFGMTSPSHPVDVNGTLRATTLLGAVAQSQLTSLVADLALKAPLASPAFTGNGPRLPSYTVAGVPSASTAGAGAMIYVSNETGGATPAFRMAPVGAELPTGP